MGAFQVLRQVNGRRVVLLDTDDGLEAEVYVHDLIKAERMTNRTWDYTLKIKGFDPSHTDDGTGNCSTCGRSLTNGCYASHFPCGFKFKAALVTYMDEWRASHFAAPEGVSDDGKGGG